MALPSLLVEYNSQQFRLARRENYDAIRFHFVSVKADDIIQLQTNDLATCNGRWVDISGPIWPFVHPSLQRLRVKLVKVEPVRRANRVPTENLMIHVELQHLGRMVPVRIQRSTTPIQLQQMLQEQAGIAAQQYRVTFNGMDMPPGDPMFARGVRANATLILSRAATPCQTETPGSLGPNRSFQVMIQSSDPAEASFPVEVESHNTIETLKAKIEGRTAMPPNEQWLLHSGRQLEDHRTLSDYGLQRGATIELVSIMNLKIGKPVIYVFPPTGITIEARVQLSLVPEWEFSAIYPVIPAKRGPIGGQTVSWIVQALPEGSLRETQTGLDVSYLYWEAATKVLDLWSPPPSPLANGSVHTVETFIPNHPTLNDSSSVLVSLQELTPYLDKALLALGLHTEARTSFITYWLPSFNKHKNVALRFLPQEAYEKAAPLDVQPKPDVVARIFMLFQGIEDADLEYWRGAAQRAEESVEVWAEVVGIDKARVLDPSSFRVIEWGGMEVRG
ncbi:ubiquitin family-domain-containing protein [Coprinopsis sp. MPI-PUGE-AT-0042]|nr:ubiquitin family-domain-containing protein [Coprinopsis sp. MPI-PUGE-AT-0042]